MTNQTAYDPHPHLDPRQPKQRRWWLTPLIVTGSVLVGVVLGVAANSAADPIQSSSGATYDSLDEWERHLDEREDAADAEQDGEPVVDEPEPEPVAVTPVADDFTLSVRTLEKQCFGSAGCLVTFQIDAGWALDLDPTITYEVTYEIKGGDEPLINTMRVQGESYFVDETETISTPSSESELTAHVLEVRER